MHKIWMDSGNSNFLHKPDDWNEHVYSILCRCFGICVALVHQYLASVRSLFHYIIIFAGGRTSNLPRTQTNQVESNQSSFQHSDGVSFALSALSAFTVYYDWTWNKIIFSDNDLYFLLRGVHHNQFGHQVL